MRRAQAKAKNKPEELAAFFAADMPAFLQKMEKASCGAELFFTCSVQRVSSRLVARSV